MVFVVHLFDWLGWKSPLYSYYMALKACTCSPSSLTVCRTCCSGCCWPGSGCSFCFYHWFCWTTFSWVDWEVLHQSFQPRWLMEFIWWDHPRLSCCALSLESWVLSLESWVLNLESWVLSLESWTLSLHFLFLWWCQRCPFKCRIQDIDETVFHLTSSSVKTNSLQGASGLLLMTTTYWFPKMYCPRKKSLNTMYQSCSSTLFTLLQTVWMFDLCMYETSEHLCKMESISCRIWVQEIHWSVDPHGCRLRLAESKALELSTFYLQTNFVSFQFHYNHVKNCLIWLPLIFSSSLKSLLGGAWDCDKLK